MRTVVLAAEALQGSWPEATSRHLKVDRSRRRFSKQPLGSPRPVKWLAPGHAASTHLQGLRARSCCEKVVGGPVATARWGMMVRMLPLPLSCVPGMVDSERHYRGLHDDPVALHGHLPVD